VRDLLIPTHHEIETYILSVENLYNLEPHYTRYLDSPQVKGFETITSNLFHKTFNKWTKAKKKFYAYLRIAPLLPNGYPFNVTF
jgi:hypothetical protein